MTLFRFAIMPGLALLLAACPQLPRPFEHERANPLLDLDDRAGVVLAFESDIPADFAKAVQTALAKQDVPARIEAAPKGALPLKLRQRRESLSPESDRLELFWELHDSEGLVIDHFDQQARVGAKDWAQGASPLMKRLAEEAAPRLARLMPVEEGTRPSDSPLATAKRPRLLLESVEGAPGDGNTALTGSMRLALSAKGIEMAASPEADVFRLKAKVRVEKTPPAGQSLHIDWILSDPKGAEMAVLEQDGAVPEGLLDKPWGLLAREIVAGTAQELAGLLKEAGISLKPRS
jgi:hypothetical protein